MFMEYVIDGNDKVLGRISSKIAKLLLQGNTVHVINSENIVISGHLPNIFARYKQLMDLKNKANPEHSPYWSRRPDMFVKRVIRGMLPYKKPKGKEAYKSLRVYIAVPDELKAKEISKMESKSPSDIFENVVTIKQLVTKLGYKE